MRPLPPWVLLLLPVSVGTLVMKLGGAPASRWGVHVASALLGLIGYAVVVALPPLPSRRTAAALAVVAVTVVAGALAAAGIDGVHRWYALGALRLHPSALLTPTLVVAASELSRARPMRAQALLSSLQAVHIAQPDAGQASATGAAAVALALASLTGASRVVVVVAHLALVGVAWARPDPLPPAPFVEDIVARAVALGPLAGVTAALSLAAFIAAPHARKRDRTAALALAAYFAASLLATTAGEFPVPLLGFGPSPLVGAFLGLAAMRRTAAPAREVSGV